jgi:HD-GYP domain-containing protein (c-di-GMP phosphodiesterase class II)
MHSLEQSQDILLDALARVLALKDSHTEGHSKRVVVFTIAIARAMALLPGQIRVLARAALLHDIGNIAIPDAILRKSGGLSRDEKLIMNESCRVGYEILQKIPFLKEEAEIVYAHREHFDGTGYPRCLKGKDIPLGARVLSVTSALDAITSDRPYRPKESLRAASEEIKLWSGRQFDPEVVDVFLSLPEGVWHDIRSEIDGRLSRDDQRKT